MNKQSYNSTSIILGIALIIFGIYLTFTYGTFVGMPIIIGSLLFINVNGYRIFQNTEKNFGKNNPSVHAQLQYLKKLYDNEQITEEEFAKQRKALFVRQ